MITITDIRKYMTVWNRQTYRKGLEYCFSIKNDKPTYDMTIEVLRLQGLESKVMNGFSIEKLPMINERKTEIVFSSIFWEMVNQYITPVYFLSLIVKQCLDNGIDNPTQVAGIVGRGLRALPSFFRELDLIYKVSQMFPNAEILNGPKQDIVDHTDLLIISNNCEYRLWSYQNSPRGLDNTAARFSGNRGEIPRGYHVLCPIDISNRIEVEEVEGWCFYSKRYINYLFEMISIEKPDEYKSIVRLQTYAMKIYLSKGNIVKK